MNAAAASPGAEPQGAAQRTLSQLDAVHPHSASGPFAVSEDGAFLYVAEAGVLAVIAPDTPASWADPVKLAPISSRGVRAVELMLDPDADPTNDPQGAANVLYVAGGRQGLWVMQADATPTGAMPAARIDDPGDAWCNALEVLQLGDEHWLLALFAEQGCSDLRVYPLAAARAVLPAGVETGNELTPAAEIPLGGNCSFQTPRYESFGLGLAVDGPYVYVAMGPYGIVRVEFLNANDVSQHLRKDGPWFGDGSWYANSLHSLYDDYEYRAGEPVQQTGAAPAVWTEAPYFVDVAVEVDPADPDQRHLLWAAVDHLGLVRFDVTDPLTWSTSTPLDHHEGQYASQDTYLDNHVQLIADPGSKVRTYAHRLSIAQTDAGPALAVAASRKPLIFSDSLLDLGRVLPPLGQGFRQVPTDPIGNPDTSGDHQYTVLYDLGSLTPVTPTPAAPPASQQAVTFLRDGGQHVHLRRVSAGAVHVYAANAGEMRAPFDDPAGVGPVTEFETLRTRLSWPAGGTVQTFTRRSEDRPGRLVYDISHSSVNPELVYTGSNDAGLAADGFLATCGATFERFAVAGDDPRGTFGILFNPFAVWPQAGTREFVFGVGVLDAVPNASYPKPNWMLAHVDAGSDLCGANPVAPDRVKRLYVLPPQDNFQSRGRGYYSGGAVNVDYDAHTTAQGLQPAQIVAFASRTGSPAGVVVLDRSIVEANILDPMVGDEESLQPPVAHKRDLITHPEFQHIYGGGSPPPNFLGANGLAGLVGTMFPRLSELPAPVASEDPEHWVLSVPCWAVQFPDDLPSAPPLPAPVWTDNFDHAMVRVFDVHSYSAISSPTGLIPNYTVLGPRPDASAIRVEPLEWDGNHYLFVADFGGSVQVWKLTELLQNASSGAIEEALSSPYFFADWVAPPSVRDEVPNNVWGLAVDHVEWTEGEATHDKVYVYVAVGRVGIEVLEFDPTAAFASRLQFVERLETPSGMAGLRIRQEADPSQRTLLVGESRAGLRTFVYED